MKKIIAGVVVVLALGAYWWWSERSSPPSAVVEQPITSTTTATATTTPSSQYKDGTYTGAVANSVYGPIQVSATVSGGTITDVTFLQYPQSPAHSLDVSNMAMPQLKTEAIAAQSAKVNVISGATQDSQAFEQSLSSALAQAQS